MWKRTDETADILKRIVMILISLASLADRAANSPPARRRYLLGLLHAGEIAALSLLLDTPFSRQTAALWSAPPDDTAEGASMAAFRLRWLAFMIGQMLGALGAPDREWDAHAVRRAGSTRTMLRSLAVCELFRGGSAFPDTS